MSKLLDDIIQWTKDYLGDTTKVVIGISGGVDSSVTAAILKAAIGRDRIFAVQMPCGEQKDISDSDEIIKFLELTSYCINIGSAYTALYDTISEKTGLAGSDFDMPESFTTNTPARIRMTVLYGLAAIIGNCRVVNTCNLSEDMVGYATKFGDHAGDFSIINKLTKTDVRQLGVELGLPEHLVMKTPIDGMSLNEDGSYKSDEDKLGISYSDLDTLIRTGEATDEVRSKVFKLYNANKHKADLKLPSFNPKLPNYIDKRWTEVLI